MTHTDYRFSITKPLSASFFSVVLTALGMLGCSAEAMPNAETDDVSSVSEAVAQPHTIVIHYTDDRPATFLQVGITTKDQSNGAFLGGNTTVPGPMVGGNNGQEWMIWDEHGLVQWVAGTTGLPAYDQNASWITILDAPNAPHRFTTMRVSVLAMINGSCHQDYEDVDISQGVDLDFTGYGASFNGTCWRGDLLKHH
jgi:hypothetical protein